MGIEQKEGMTSVTSNTFLRVEEVAQQLGVSKSYAYKIVQKLNKELKDKGYLTISGRINRQFFIERFQYEKQKGQ